MMKEVILLLTVLVMFIVCFFVMGKIGYFINENYKAFIIEERENTQSCKIISLDKISDEELLKEIHDYQKKCGKASMIIYDSKKEDKRQCFDGDKAVWYTLIYSWIQVKGGKLK